ncbi:MAG: hypothetical protein AMJ60_09955 [Desulfobacterales bacterium SG8_35]|nr:MAG: hypothetical protein AMJ60_09955 [Desulfobacterales bacterium SG8_35]
MDTPKTLAERKKDIQFLMKYAVPEDQVEAAYALLEKYDADIIALNLLHSFYIHLPEGTDDSVNGLRLLTRRQGVFLICVSTGRGFHYLYVVNNEAAHIIGTLAEGIIDRELLDFFGYADNKEVLALTKEPEKLQVYEPYAADSNLCPSCHAAVGEFHTLGCPVEICPWCRGQLTYCNCRFTRLDIESMDKVAQIEKLRELLEEVGRIVFKKEHSPGYPTMDEE